MTYKLDRADAQRWTQRDKESDARSAREYGFYGYHVLKVLPLRDIHSEAVWNTGRIESIREAIREGKALPAIQVSQHKDGKYHISDGIHRYNASLEAGFTHVPAIVSVMVDTPEMKEAPEPEKPKLQVGDWVILREPVRGESEWARVEEVLPSKTWQGVRRHFYGLVGVRHGEGDFIGDHRDDQFDPAPSPPSSTMQEAVMGWYGWSKTSLRVAHQHLRR